MVESDVVDGPDGHVRVSVRGEQHPLGVRLQLQGGAQQLDAGHLRHPLVDKEERHGAAAQSQLAHRFERLGARAGGDHPVVGAVSVSQVALHGPQNRQVIVDGEKDRLGRHGAPV